MSKLTVDTDAIMWYNLNVDLNALFAAKGDRIIVHFATTRSFLPFRPGLS